MDRTEDEKESAFREELDRLLNRYSKEKSSNTPDFILGKYLRACLDAFNNAILERNQWYRM